MRVPQHQAEGQGPHASADDLARFVIDALDPSARRRLECHVTACAACAEALAQEAAAELSLQALWSEVDRPLAPVLALPVPAPAGTITVAVSAPVVPVVVPVGASVGAPAAMPIAAPQVTPGATRSRLLPVARSASWNGLAAAAVTVLFLGYWTGAGTTLGSRAPGGLSALEAAMAPGPAFCDAGDSLVAGLCGPAQGESNVSDGVREVGAVQWACSAAEPDEATCATPARAAVAVTVADDANLCREPVAGMSAHPGQL